ncbi:MAG: phage scaffolding protein, partial [Butyricicoccus pullicaecorum]|nr:phage scaffolding protein [Butyricicoccus pullicaecorum]
MTREELKALTVPEELWGNILDLNSRDIGKIKDKFDTVKAENDNLKTQVEESQNTISVLESAKNNADKLQEEIDRYKAAEKDRKQA